MMNKRLLTNHNLLNLFTNNDYDKYFKNNYDFFTKIKKNHIKLYKEENIFKIMKENNISFNFSNKLNKEWSIYYTKKLLDITLIQKDKKEKVIKI